MITIQYGPNNNVEKSVAEYPSVRSILNDTILASLLGFTPDAARTEARINGNVARGSDAIPDGSLVDLISTGNTKGS